VNKGLVFGLALLILREIFMRNLFNKLFDYLICILLGIVMWPIFLVMIIDDVKMRRKL
jgi:hypothetical protein